MSAYPCVDGLPAATESCGIAIGVVAPGVVAAGPGKPSTVYAGPFIVPGTVAMWCGVPVA
ncbi:MAG: hypothetical protein QOI46_767, partial [Alphaproteobacteria bacterium]|nr:hypothetical protein [Alphaproteobacteria bacterium]